MDRIFARFANGTAKVTGSPLAFIVCVLTVVLWAASGPACHFSETWQLVINTGTTIVTFLMVFLIQNTQNRDGAALQAKLDELIRAMTDADDEFMGIEKLTDAELEEMHNKAVERSSRNENTLREIQDARGRRGAAKAVSPAKVAPASST